MAGAEESGAAAEVRATAAALGYRLRLDGGGGGGDDGSADDGATDGGVVDGGVRMVDVAHRDGGESGEQATAAGGEALASRSWDAELAVISAVNEERRRVQARLAADGLAWDAATGYSVSHIHGKKASTFGAGSKNSHANEKQEGEGEGEEDPYSPERLVNIEKSSGCALSDELPQVERHFGGWLAAKGYAAPDRLPVKQSVDRIGGGGNGGGGNGGGGGDGNGAGEDGGLGERSSTDDADSDAFDDPLLRLSNLFVDRLPESELAMSAETSSGTSIAPGTVSSPEWTKYRPLTRASRRPSFGELAAAAAGAALFEAGAGADGVAGTPAPGILASPKLTAAVRDVDGEHARLRLVAAAAVERVTTAADDVSTAASGSVSTAAAQQSASSSQRTPKRGGWGSSKTKSEEEGEKTQSAPRPRRVSPPAPADGFRPWPRIVHVVNLFEHSGASKAGAGTS